MKKTREILGGLWKIYAALWFTGLLVILYPVYKIWLKKEKNFRKAMMLLKWHTRLLMVVTGIKLIVKNRHLMDKNKAYIITPNHTSYADILILYHIVPNYFVFLGKEELKKIPLFNIFFKDMNIGVNRKSATSGKLALERCGRELDKGNSVVLFPEGTIPKSCPELGKFKLGAFKLAIEKQIPVVPITFLSNYRRLEMSGLFSGKAGPGMAKAIIHEPIPTVGLTEADLIPLSEKVFDIINKEVEKHNKKKS
ncbi:MAG: 1-acyl-sn-glycerol-3-phosphate acyltransferase [Flavobacteriales bacterium]|jgi:1-acyl-sn-glycerol-3-phosphate acyltransferase|nr:1-acyl-sn-glycerol-3-phosphate acyltransferase [Flavobacteriales bacterium]